MPLLNIVVMLILVRRWVVPDQPLHPHGPPVSKHSQIVVVVVVCVWLLQVFGLWTNVTNFRLTH